MAKVAFHLPGNRGVLSGPEGTVIGNEMRRQQAKELPKEGPLFLSNGLANSSMASLMPAAGRIILGPLENVNKTCVVKYARIYVVMAAAGSVTYASLYRLQSPGEMALRAVAKTQATFDCSATGMKTYTLSGPVEILPGSRYLLGVLCNTDLIRIAGIANSAGSPISRLTLDGATSLPDVVALTTLTRQPSAQMMVAYLTEFGNQVF